MKEKRPLRLGPIMRSLHLYTGMFLVPWMLVYGASAFCLNHGRWITQRFKIAPPQWVLVREVKFTPEATFPKAPDEQAQAIMQRLDLDGPHRIMGKPNANQMVILRVRAGGNYRVTWHRKRSVLALQRQPFSFYRLLHFLHFRHGYSQRYLPLVAWAVVVDMAAVSMWLWVISGIYIWARRPRRRLAGGTILAVGCLLFVVLMVSFCL